jgi:regulator of sigma E protease
MNILVAILMFSVIIVIHELGHFLLAKKNGIAVTEFSVGMGPRIISVVKTSKGFSMKLFASTDDCNSLEEWKDRTKYSIKLFPVGGSCMMLGEDEILENENAFNKKNVWARISVIAAGPIFNFILAFFLAVIVIGVAGYDPSTVVSVDEGMPMQEAGIQKGDVITNIDGTTIDIGRELSIYFQFHPLKEKEMKITYERNGEKNTVLVTPKLNEENAYKLGFGFGDARVKTTPFNVLKYSFIEVRFWIKTTVESLGQLILGKISRNDLAGPVGVVDMVGNAVKESRPYGMVTTILSVCNMGILLSANLGVMNLLPIPALDGGRLVFLVLEAIRRKPVDQEKEGMVHLIGLVALMILMVFVMFNDISRLIG